MLFAFECPKCKATFQVRSLDMANNLASIKCGVCGDAPAPDILTAYQNVGKTMVELQGCCSATSTWLPKDIRPSRS
jgi:predicted Zn finger-like uncharacterized protein